MSQSINLYNQLANHKLFNKSVNFGLKRIKLALALLGHPEKKLKNVISVVGESGKFTTLFSLKSFIEASNQNVTTHISPSLRDIRERFYMGEKYLSHKEIKKTIKQIEKLNIPLTIFECLTLVYIINASKINVDYNIQETGALWRLDSNNIHDFPKLQICTNINKQHLNFLKRKTLDEVIKEDVRFLSDFTNIYIGKQSPNVLRKIKTHLKNNKSKFSKKNIGISSKKAQKVLKDINGVSVLETIFKRLSNCKMLDNIIVATTTNNSDDIIADVCSKNNINYYRGSENNVLDRFYKTATKFNAKNILRITADCP